MSYEIKRAELVKRLIFEGRIYSKEVEQAFLETPREVFVPDSIKKHAYLDTPLEIGNGQTISAPHMVAIMVEGLDIKKGQKILEIGAGSGYHAAIVSKLIGKDGHLYTIERHSTLAVNAKKNILDAGITNITIETGDGSRGLSKFAPYDRIYVTCAAPGIPPPLIEQLKDKGKLMIPVGKTICELKLIEKKAEKLIESDLGGCSFVPLVGKHGF
jgi:protein-L-isoaspartate(D-aspartate) O-methyltransferase